MNHLYEPQGDREITNELSPQDVGFIAGGAGQSVETTRKNMTAIESGFFDAVDNSWLKSEQQMLKAFEQVHHVRTKTSSKLGREAQGEALKGLGLSKGAKVRHGKKHKHIERFITRNSRMKARSKTFSTFGINIDHDIANHTEQLQGAWIGGKYHHQGKSRAYLMKRDWSQQIKMQMVYSPRPSDAPAVNVGERYTENLTSRAVRKIFESGAYVAACQGGFTTFLTLTFDDIQRAKLFATDSNVHLTAEGNQFSPLSEDMAPYSPLQTTIGSEVSRFLEGAKRVYQRGFEYKPSEHPETSGQHVISEAGEVVKVEGHYKPAPLMGLKKQVELFGPAKPLSKKRWKAAPLWGCESKIELVGPSRARADFHYIWVAECPVNKHGQPNPHVHILLNWQVEPHHFQAWAARLENLWSNGFAKLERIKHSQGAAAYIIKAVGYAAKGGNADQGMIKGNRYNIARCSRAPSWEVLASFDSDNMAAIIKECGYKLERWRKPIEKEIARKAIKRDEAIKAAEIHKANKPKAFKLRRLIQQLESEIIEQKERLRSRGVFARSDNTFSICFEGDKAAEKMDAFLVWAAGARNWSMNTNDINLEGIREHAANYYENDYQRFLEKRAEWQSQLKQDYYAHDEQALKDIKTTARELISEYEQITSTCQ